MAAALSVEDPVQDFKGDKTNVVLSKPAQTEPDLQAKDTPTGASPFEVLQTETPVSTYDVGDPRFTSLTDVKTIRATYNLSPVASPPPTALSSPTLPDTRDCDTLIVPTRFKTPVDSYSETDTMTGDTMRGGGGTEGGTNPEYLQALDRIATDHSGSSPAIEDVKFDIGSPRDIFKSRVQIGKGAFADVFKALDSRDGTQVALKVISKTVDDRALRKEISILKDCKCDEVIALRGCFDYENKYWIVQEFCEAGSLADLQQFHKTFSEDEIAVILEMVLRGLLVLHGKKKIHRDIKAANILINAKGQCKIADFGVSALMDSTKDFRSTMTGTPYWMAPEILRSQPYNAKADIWSLGITCIELLTGKAPHSELGPLQAMFKITGTTALPDLPKDMSPDFRDFVVKCLAIKAEERPTAEALLQHKFLSVKRPASILEKVVEANLARIAEEQKKQHAEELARQAQDEAKLTNKEGWGSLDSVESSGGEDEKKLKPAPDKEKKGDGDGWGEKEKKETLGTNDEQSMGEAPPYVDVDPQYDSYNDDQAPEFKIHVEPPAEKSIVERELDDLVSPGDPDLIFIDRVAIGEGAFGQVFKATDTRDKKPVALKGIEEHSANTRVLLKEITILQECACKNIVAYKGCFRKGHLFYIAMELCEVGSVFDLMLNCEQTLTELQVAAVAKSCLQGLVALHSKRKIHRDIKAGNILLNKDGECKLADFGVSAQLNSTSSLRGTTTGTPYWMAPEVLTKEPYSNKADVWSLGICAIEMATADVPHSAVPPLQAMCIIPTQPSPALPRGRWSKEFQDFVTQCCTKTFSARPSSAQLLQHPFVKDVKEVDVLKALVSVCLPRINAARERLARERQIMEQMRQQGQQSQDQDYQDQQEDDQRDFQLGGIAEGSREEDEDTKRRSLFDQVSLDQGTQRTQGGGTGGTVSSEEGDNEEETEQKRLFRERIRTRPAFEIYRTTLQYQNQPEVKKPVEKKGGGGGGGGLGGISQLSVTERIDMKSFGELRQDSLTTSSNDLDKLLIKLQGEQALPQIGTPTQELAPGGEPEGLDLLAAIQKELSERVPQEDNRTSHSAPGTTTSGGDLDMLEQIRRKLLTA